MSLSSFSSLGSLIKQSISSGSGSSVATITQTIIQTGVSLLLSGPYTGHSIGISKSGRSIVYVTNTKAVRLSTNYGASFSTVTSTTLNNCTQVCVSDDGVYIILLNWNSSMFISSNSGSSWTSASISGVWSVSMSSTGQYLIATVSANNIYVSTNYGATWTLKVSASNAGILCYINTTGQYMVASQSKGTSLSYQYSNDYGSTFTEKTSGASGYFGRNIAMSNDGSSFVGSWIGTNAITISRNAGSSTSFSSSTILAQITADMFYQLVINGNGNDVYFISGNKIQKSSDLLQTYSAVGSTNVSSGLNLYSSANCKYILTLGSSGNLYLTTNSGITEV